MADHIKKQREQGKTDKEILEGLYEYPRDFEKAWEQIIKERRAKFEAEQAGPTQQIPPPEGPAPTPGPMPKPGPEPTPGGAPEPGLPAVRPEAPRGKGPGEPLPPIEMGAPKPEPIEDLTVVEVGKKPEPAVKIPKLTGDTAWEFGWDVKADIPEDQHGPIIEGLIKKRQEWIEKGKKAEAEGDFDGMMEASSKGQFYHEAYQAITGKRLDGPGPAGEPPEAIRKRWEEARAKKAKESEAAIPEWSDDFDQNKQTMADFLENFKKATPENQAAMLEKLKAKYIERMDKFERVEELSPEEQAEFMTLEAGLKTQLYHEAYQEATKAQGKEKRLEQEFEDFKKAKQGAPGAPKGLPPPKVRGKGPGEPLPPIAGEGPRPEPIISEYRKQFNKVREEAGERAAFTDPTLKELYKTEGEDLVKKYRARHPKGPIVLYKPSMDRGAMIHPSTKEPGGFQLTWFDDRGFSGDMQYKTEAEAVAEAFRYGNNFPDPERAARQMTTERFLEGIAKIEAAQKKWEEEAKKAKEVPKPEETGKELPKPGKAELKPRAPEAQIYINRQKRADKIQYAEAYDEYLRGDMKGPPPEPPLKMPMQAGQAVRMRLHEIYDRYPEDVTEAPEEPKAPPTPKEPAPKEEPKKPTEAELGQKAQELALKVVDIFENKPETEIEALDKLIASYHPEAVDFAADLIMDRSQDTNLPADLRTRLIPISHYLKKRGTKGEYAPKEPPPPMPRHVKDAAKRFKQEGRAGIAWTWTHEMTQEAKNDFDEYLVKIQHPLSFQPGTQEGRFMKYVEDYAKTLPEEKPKAPEGPSELPEEEALKQWEDLQKQSFNIRSNLWNALQKTKAGSKEAQDAELAFNTFRDLMDKFNAGFGRRTWSQDDRDRMQQNLPTQAYDFFMNMPKYFTGAFTIPKEPVEIMLKRIFGEGPPPSVVGEAPPPIPPKERREQRADLEAQVKKALKKAKEGEAPGGWTNATEEGEVKDPSGMKWEVFKVGNTVFQIPAYETNLHAFLKALKSFPTTAPPKPGGQKRVKPPSASGTAAKKETVDDLVPLEDIPESEGWWTDGHIVVKGDLPKSPTYREGKAMPWEDLQGAIEKPNKISASLRYYVSQLEGVGLVVSKEPVMPIGDFAAGQEPAVVIFKAGPKRFAFSQFRFNAIRNRYPEATYRISYPSSWKDPDLPWTEPYLYAYEGKTLVGVLASLKAAKEPWKQKEIPGIKKAAKMGIASKGAFNVDNFATYLTNGMEMPEILSVYREMTQGKLPKILKHFYDPGVRGFFVPAGRGKGTISLLWWIFNDPQQATATLAHEIGHWISWYPWKKMPKGNVFAHIGALKEYMKTVFPKAPGLAGELTSKDRARLKKEARKLLLAENPGGMIDEVIKKETPITPQDILNIWNTLDAGKDNPDLLNYIKTLNSTLKKLIIKQALKGEVPEELKKFAKIVEVKTGKKIPYTPSEEAILARYKQLVEEELKKRQLFHVEEMTAQMTKLSRIWREWPVGLDPLYDAYRRRPSELYADGVSAIFMAPPLVKKWAPDFYEAWFNYLEARPDLHERWNEVMAFMNRPRAEVLRDRDRDILDDFALREKEWGDELQKWRDSAKDPDFWGYAFIDKYWAITRRLNRVGEGMIDPRSNPRYKIEHLEYDKAEAEGYMSDIWNELIRPMEKLGISNETFGLYLFHRRVALEAQRTVGKGVSKAAPRGHTPITSREAMDRLEAEYEDLPKFADKFDDLNQEWILDKIQEIKMHTPALLKHLRTSMGYATFDIVGWTEENYGVGPSSYFYRRWGTFRGTGNPFTATVMRNLKIIHGANVEMASRAVIKTFQDLIPEDIKPADVHYDRNRRKRLPKEPRDPSKGLIMSMRNGDLSGYYVPKYVAKAFEKNPFEAMAISTVLRYFAEPFRALFVEYNPGFMLFNMMRDYLRMLKTTPNATMLNMTGDWFKAWGPALRSVYGKPDDLAKIIQKGAGFITVANYRGDQPDEVVMDKLMRRFHMTPQRWVNNVLGPINQFLYYVQGLGRGIERVPKVAGYTFLKRRFPDMHDEIIFHILRNTGSPPFLRRGAWSPIYNNLLLFSNARKEGWRGDYDAFKQTPGEYAWKTAKYNLIPKIIQYALSAFILKEVYDRISNYDKTNYNCFAVGITPKGRVVYFRFPEDETGRFVGGLTWQILESGKPEQYKDILRYLTKEVPDFNPGLKLAWEIMRFASGHNIYDTWRRRMVLSDREMEAGGTYAWKEFMKWAADESGMAIIHRFNGETLDEIKDEMAGIVGVPFLKSVGARGVELSKQPVLSNVIGRFVKVSDRGVGEKIDEQWAKIRREMARVSIDLESGLNKLLQEGAQGRLSDKEKNAIALYASQGKINDRALKLLAFKYNQVYISKLVTAKSEAERLVVLKHMEEDKLWRESVSEMQEKRELPKAAPAPEKLELTPQSELKAYDERYKTLREAIQASKGGKKK